MSSQYPVLGNRPIDQWKVTELKEELKRRKLMTKGLKEDLIKRLDEAIRIEQENADVNKDNGFDSVPFSETLGEHERRGAHVSKSAQDSSNISHTITQEINEDMLAQVTNDQGRSSLSILEEAEDSINRGESANDKISGNKLYVDINEVQGSVKEKFGEWEGADGSDSTGMEGKQDDQVTAKETTVKGSVEEKFGEREGADGSDSTGMEGKQADQVTAKETSDLVAENLEPVIALDEEDLQNVAPHNGSLDLKAQLETEDSKSLHVDAIGDLSVTNIQVSEVNPFLGLQVKSDSVPTESVTVIGINELNDNVIADDVKLELDVKREMVQPSSSSPDGGKSHPTDVEEPHANKVSVEETNASNAEIVDIIPKNNTADLGFSEKPNLGSCSADDIMKENVMESKQVDLKTDSDEMRIKESKVEGGPTSKDESFVDIVNEAILAEKKVAIIENKNGPALSVKRKLNDQRVVGNSDTAKKGRWNSEGLKVPDSQSDDVVSSAPKDVLGPAFKRRFSRSDSTVEEVPKERVVPPSPKPPTNSLRIDRFLRPFTLKAVQELLGKTGTVINFWMDQIKTHCYVSYTSVEEAVETRNAVFNLQWPPNGGRLLVAEFVDPQEVRLCVEPPAQTPATPVSSDAVPSFPQNMQPQPSPRQQQQKQQLPQPPLPPPPPLFNPPPAREQPAPVKERLILPPPPPLPEKTDPPIVTLDDLFRKTKASPRIYYLPLSNEQVVTKLQAKGLTGKQ